MFDTKRFEMVVSKRLKESGLKDKRIKTEVDFTNIFTSSFFIQKSFKHFFSTYRLCFFGKTILAKKLLVKCW